MRTNNNFGVNFGVNFGGRRRIHPGAYDVIDPSEMTIVSRDGTSLPVIVGVAEGGEPNVLRWFDNAISAKNYLKGGELYTAVELMFSPVPEGGGGASSVGVVVVNQNTGASVTAGGMTYSSLVHGKDGNKIQVKVEDGTIEGSKRCSVYEWDENIVEVFNNLGTVMKLAYVGDGAIAKLTITPKKLEVIVDDEIDLSLNLEEDRFATIAHIVNHISSISGYRCQIINTESQYLDTTELDPVEDVALTDTDVIITALHADFNYQLNQHSELVSVSGSGPIENIPLTYLEGGITGTTPLSWAPAFDVIKNDYSDILVVLSSDESVHAEASTHVSDMVAKGQRQLMFTGGGISESPQRAMERARALGNSRTVLCYPDIFHKSYKRGKDKLPAYMTAALIAGRVCGVDASEPITFDYVDVIGLGRDLMAGDYVIDQMLLAGVCTLEKVQNGGIRIVQGITTYTSVNNTVYREISVRRGADRLSEQVRYKLEVTFVGKKGLRPTITSVETVVMDELDRAVRDEEISAYDPRSIQVRFENTAVFVEYKVAAVDPINYILLTSRFVPDSSIK